MLKAEDLDFVDIVTRSTTHLELISLAAERGLAIICQKPMAPDWETACRMVEIAESHGVRFMMHDNWRWQSWYRAAARNHCPGRYWNSAGLWIPLPGQPMAGR